jgi:hypothetical protein
MDEGRKKVQRRQGRAALAEGVEPEREPLADLVVWGTART